MNLWHSGANDPNRLNIDSENGSDHD